MFRSGCSRAIAVALALLCACKKKKGEGGAGSVSSMTESGSSAMAGSGSAMSHYGERTDGEAKTSLGPASRAADLVPLVIRKADTTYSLLHLSLKPMPMHVRFRACASVRYADQLSAGHCSALAVSTTLVLTARHCVANAVTNALEVEKYVFAFGFLVDANGSEPTGYIPDGEWHDGVVAVESDVMDAWALVRVKPAIAPIHVQSLQSTSDDAAPIYALGYPLGVPLKVTLHGQRRVGPDGSVWASLDTYPGSSGGPVFSHADDGFVGMVSAGLNGLISSADCSRDIAGPEDAGPSTRIIPASAFRAALRRHAQWP